jgi:vitamin B12 transporter
MIFRSVFSGTFTAPSRALALIALPFITLNSWASPEAASPQDAPAHKALEEIVVTANRLPQTEEDLLGSVSVIDASDLDLLRPRDLTEAVAVTNGVAIARQGGQGSLTSVSLRGSRTTQTLSLINGSRYGSASAGFANLSEVPVEFVEQVEVLRGQGSALYGSDAIGGVINVVPIGQSLGQDRLSLGMSVGSLDSHQDRLVAEKRLQSTQLALGLRRAATAGYDRTLSTLGTNADEDPHRNQAGFASAYHEVDEGRIGLFSFTSRSTLSYDEPSNDPAFSPWADPSALESLQPEGVSELAMTQLYAERKITDYYTLRLQMSQADDSLVSADSYPGFFNSRNRNVEWVNRLQLPLGINLVAGASRDHSKLDSSTAYEAPNGQADRSVTGHFAQIHIDQSFFALELGGREDRNSQYGRQGTGYAAAEVRPLEFMSIFGQWGEGFRAPTFNDLWLPYYGNSALKPEESINRNGGLRFSFENLTLSSEYYETHYRNLIAFDQTFKPYNINRAKARGVETQLKWNTIYAGELSLGMDFGKVQNLTTEQRTLITPAKLGFLRWEYHPGPVTTAFWLQGQSRRDTGYSQTPGFVVANAMIGWQLQPHFRLALQSNNLGDTDYQYDAAYREEGRSFRLSADLTLE